MSFILTQAKPSFKNPRCERGKKTSGHTRLNFYSRVVDSVNFKSTKTLLENRNLFRKARRDKIVVIFINMALKILFQAALYISEFGNKFSYNFVNLRMSKYFFNMMSLSDLSNFYNYPCNKNDQERVRKTLGKL
jgi:hypothetical protein